MVSATEKGAPLATHSFIFAAEADLMDCSQTVDNVIVAYSDECNRTIGEHKRNRPYGENRDAWGTMLVHALLLRKHLNTLIATMSQEFPNETQIERTSP